MKNSLVVLFLSAFAVCAQTWLVRWTGTNAYGVPQYWPVIVSPCKTNAVPPKGHYVLTAREIDSVILTNRAAFDAAMQAAANQELAAKDATASKLATGIATLRSNVAKLSVLEIEKALDDLAKDSDALTTATKP